jgi:ribonuclease HII
VTPRTPTPALERALAAEGFLRIAGLDEVGRGAWAGPVSVGVAVVPSDRRAPSGLRDSKQVPEAEREVLFGRVSGWCVDWSVGHADPQECDRWGMTVALRLAARRALAGLAEPPDVVVMDGSFDYVSGADDGKVIPPVRTVVRGDASCRAIAAASIVAKVTRDRMMRELTDDFPPFDFHRNKGYPSPVHRRALDGHGLTAIHRRTWSYVDQLPYR